ncbi:protein NYNRIN-like [Gossypium australe]|uniref:Protein NYNRIN-like n=1 Tax=Gossypium australe TaxID=47621 RepID=A0A5B6X1Y9_9ROSI|nr:protein NYNRIN-like [Gossypium australe]
MVTPIGINDCPDKKEFVKLQHKVARYTVLESVLYKKGFSQPLLRCLAPSEPEYAGILLAHTLERCTRASSHMRFLLKVRPSTTTAIRTLSDHVNPWPFET